MSSSSRNKRGSSRRRGDEFQDLSALRLILELYASGENFQVFLEYENTQAIDDIVIFAEKRLRAVQAKYSIDPLAVYVPKDFTDKNSPVYFGKYAKAWQKAVLDNPNFELSIELLSNRGRDSELERIIAADGNFTPDFINGALRKKPRTFRNKLAKVCAFAGPDAEDQFQKFLKAFRFKLAERPLQELRNHLEGEILDHALGISDRNVFLQLKELIEQHAIDLHQPITRSELDEIFHKSQRHYLVPQVFPVDSEHFVEVEGFGNALRKEIDKTQSGYVVVTGLPGSGKSTSLSEFFDSIAKDDNFAVCRYFCFVSPHDDNARLRVQAEALRVNLLSELQDQFRNVLSRQFDFGEHRLTEVLSQLGSALVAQKKKLVILLDGLDHAERDVQVRDSVIRALPTALPTGVIIVVGTQELKHWQPFALKEGRAQHHIPIPPFTLAETRTYLTDKHGFALKETRIAQIYSKSEGLPLYLRYVASWLRKHGNDPETLETMPEAGDGDIRKYYARLWANFDRDGMGYARHLCGVLAALRFPVRTDELIEFQTEISSAQMDSALRTVAHLLREEDDKVSVFHDSFRVFVNSNIDATTRRRIATDIFAKLKMERGSTRWFSYVFLYALDAAEDDYLLAEVNRVFVDFALQHCRPAEEIITAIESAAKPASRRKDLVALARLGSLHYRTHERLDQFNYDMLAKVQLSLGRVGDVLSFCCRPDEQRWLVDEGVADQVMIWCAKAKHKDLGERLFEIYNDTHDSVPSATVLGIYASKPARALRLLSRFKPRRDTLERIDRFLPGYAPQLEDFLSARFHYGPKDEWRRFKRIKRLFPNNLVRHIFLRLVAKHRPKSELADELKDYLDHTPVQTNLEIAAYAAFSGFTATQVRKLSGSLTLPPREPPHQAPFEETEGVFDQFEWTAVVLGYENDSLAIGNVTKHIGNANTMYSGFLRFLLKSGLCLGRAAAKHSESENYSLALEALEELGEAGKEDEPREMDTLRACRPMLPEALFRLTTYIQLHHQEKLDAWRDRLLSLRESNMWTRHWGITETTEDYSFELYIWERLIEVPGMRSRLLPILRSCATTYEEATALKSGSRSRHFLWLAAIAASCDWRTGAEKWREKGTACSLTYGYHKDVTLDCLVDVLELLNKQESKYGLERCAAILEMAKWMWAATDNRMTKDFEQSIFRVVLQTSREAAFALIRFFREQTGRWKMLDCLEQYCVSATTGDHEALWTLKDAFAPHFHEIGRHSKQVVRTARALRDHQQTKISSDSAPYQRYSCFVRTFVDPAWWPDDIWSEIVAAESRPRPEVRDPYASSRPRRHRDLTLRGVAVPLHQIEALLTDSLESFVRTIDQIRAENSDFHDSEMVASALEIHATRAVSREASLSLWQVAQALGDDLGAKPLSAIARRLFDFGESDVAFNCLLLAYQRSSNYQHGSKAGQDYLHELCERDQDRIIAFLTERCERAFESDYGGFDLPRMVARFYSAAGDFALLRRVFEDYLTHCQELFAHLPKEEFYGWLGTYQETGRDEATEIVAFLIDLIDEPEIEQAERLVRTLADLARVRSEVVCRITCERMATSGPLLRVRLEALLEAVAQICPHSLVAHLKHILPLFKEPHFQLRMTLIRVIRAVASAVSVPAALTDAANDAERAYSPIIAYPSRKFFHLEPSREFVRFLKRHILFDLCSRIVPMCEVLNVSPETALSYVEQKLLAANWDIASEAERLKEEWRDYAHDGKAVWIVPRFHTQVSDLLQNFAHDAVENGRYDKTTLAALENVFRTADPKFVGTLPQTKPSDIPGLLVANGEKWVEEFRLPSAKKIETFLPSGWTTIYEERLQSQSHGHNIVVSVNARVRSLLISPAIANGAKIPLPMEHWADAIPTLHPEERLTINESGRRLIANGSMVNDTNEFLPLVSAHDNGLGFQGFRSLAFLHPTWLIRYNITFNDTELFSDGRCVARLEEWQEGYEDEPYSRDPLSKGMRLVVRNEWLEMVLRDSHRALAIHITEHRKWFKDFWEKEPTSKSFHGTTTYYIAK